MKLCKSYREFKKILRKYKNPTVEFRIYTKNQADEVLYSSKKGYCDISMLNVFLANKNQMVRVNNEFGILRGILINNLGSYYIVEINEELYNVKNNLIAL